MAIGRLTALVCFFYLWSGAALADIVDVAFITGSQSLVGRMDYIPDPESRITFDQALNHTGWRPLTRSNQGYVRYPFWTRIQFINSGAGLETMILRNPRPGVNYLNVYLFSDKNPVQSLRLGSLRPIENSSIVSRHSIVILRLVPGERVTVFTRIQNIGPAELEWVISETAAFSRYNFKSSLLFGLFGGMAMTLIFYNLSVWRGLRDHAYLAYSAMALFSLLFQYALNGVFRCLDLGFPLMLIFAGGWTSSGLFLLAMVIFPILFFKTAETMPWMHRILIALGFYCCLQILFNIVYLNSQDMTSYAAFTSVSIFTISSLLLILAIRTAMLALPGALYYLLGQGTFQAAVVLQWAVIVGWVELDEVSEYFIIAGTMLDIMFLSLALGSRIKTLSEEKTTYQLMAMAQSRFTSVGKAVGAIIHQWKTPLARLGTQITELRGYLAYGDPRQFAESAGQVLPAMDQSLEGMKKTIDEFGALYAADAEKELFKPKKIIDEILDLFQKRINAAGVSMVFDTDHEDMSLQSYPSYLSHVLMTLIDNALDILSERKTIDPEIRIKVKRRGTSVELSVEDNGGGIWIKPIGSIYIPFVSHKNVKGSGLGLPIAKMVVEERLGGEIRAENTSRGARFTLTIPDLLCPSAH